MPLVSRRY